MISLLANYNLKKTENYFPTKITLYYYISHYHRLLRHRGSTNAYVQTYITIIKHTRLKYNTNTNTKQICIAPLVASESEALGDSV